MIIDEDCKVIQKVLEGDKQAFEYILIKYDTRVYGFIYRIVNQEQVAQDLTQETFIKAYENLHKYNLKRNFMTWLFTIAKNTAFNYLKTKGRHEILESKYTEDLYKNTLAKNIGESPEKVFEKREKLNEFYEIINKLPRKYRELIILKYIEELSYAEISERLRIPVSRVESRLYTARQKIIKQIKKLKNCEGEVYKEWIVD